MAKRQWELMILDAAPSVNTLDGLSLGDLDGDGHVEVVIGGEGGLLWYRPDMFEKGIIAEGRFSVGLALEDLDGDGVMEVVVGEEDPATSTWMISCFKPGRDLYQPWARYVLVPLCNGQPYDLVFYDLDGGGERELLANAVSCEIPGVFIYEREVDPTGHWRKHAVAVGISGEGLGVADIDGDGKVEIVHGPDWYNPPPEGPLSGLWQRKVFAPGFREMCRTALVDITGNGLADVVLTESKYLSGRVAWFENRLVEDPGSPWIEHEMDWGVNLAHSLGARRDPGSGEIHVFLAEMAAGDWNQPYNWDARLIEYTTSNNGRTWQREILHRGAGTHQALVCDVDGDGTLEIVGKERELPRVQIWKSRATPSPLTRFHHRLLDRDKPYTGTDIVAMDVDDDGLLDVVCGAWWYKNPTWERYDIPDIYQVHNAFDIDSDGRQELIASKRSSTVPDDGYSISMDEWYHRLSSEFCWLKPVDGKWEEHPIGAGHGNWPHGTVIAPVLPGGKLALIVAYHSVHLGKEHFPEIFEVPADPKQHPWPKRVLAEILYGEEIVAHDIDGDGTLDLVAGPYWLENLGDGTFRPHQFAERLKVNQMARLRVADVNGNGKPDIVLGEQALDFENRVTPWSRLLWFEHPEDPKSSQWEMHVIDKLRCPHSLDVADLDGDGELEIVCAEHDPFKPYHSRCRLLVYKKADPQGRSWIQYVLDDRFEHHDGTKVFEVAPGHLGIISHGWTDSRYVHLWEMN